MIYLAYILPEEPEDLLSHVGESFDDHPHLALDNYGDHVNAFQQLEDPAQGWGGGGLSDLVGQGFLLLGQLLPQASLGDRIDQQGQGHHHQQALDPGGLFHKKRGREKQRFFEETEAAFNGTLSFVVGQKVFILDHLGIDGGAQYESGFALLLGASFFRIGPDGNLELPVDGLDRRVRGRTAFVGIVDMRRAGGLVDLMIRPFASQTIQAGVGLLFRVKALGLKMIELLLDSFLFLFL